MTMEKKIILQKAEMVDFDTIFDELEKSFIPEERREREKMDASLSRLGFSSADIKTAISRVKHDE